jgi:hypothetical protein
MDGDLRERRLAPRGTFGMKTGGRDARVAGFPQGLFRAFFSA